MRLLADFGWTAPLLCALALILIVPSAIGVEIVWSFPITGGHPDGSPAIADIDGDGSPNVVFTTTGGSVVAVDGEGYTVWRWEGGDAFSLGPTVVDLTGDKSLEVLVQTNRGRITCLAGATGVPLWSNEELGKLDWGMSAIVATDLDADGKPEIIASDSAGTLLCLEGSGAVRWTKHEAGSWTSCPAAGDLDGDGRPEILIGSGDSPLVCLSADGEERWRLPAKGAAWTSPVLWDLNGDDTLEIVTGIGAGVAAVDAKGKILWQYPTTRDIDAAISIGDADGDGEDEIYVVDLNGQLVSLTPQGELRWEAHVEQRARRSPALADIDLDGAMEIIVGGYSKALHVFESDGTLQERFDLGGETNATPTVANLLGNGRLQVVCAVTSGALQVYQWPAGMTSVPKIAWASYRNGPTRAAAQSAVDAQASVTLADVDFGAMHVGTNAFEVRVHNPGGKRLTTTLAVNLNGVIATATHEATAEYVSVQIPYTLNGRRPVDIAFVCTVSDGDNTVLERRRTEYLVPFARELMEAERLMGELAARVDLFQHPDELEKELAQFGALLPTFREQAALASALSGEELRGLTRDLAELSDRCRRWIAIADLAANPTSQHGVALFAANPWAPFGGMQEVVEGRNQNSELSIEAFREEIESAALNLFNAEGRPVSVRVRLDGLTKEGSNEVVAGREVLTVHAVEDVLTEAEPIADALPVLDDGETATIPAWGARQLWLNCDTARLSPGTWTTQVRVRVEGEVSFEAAAPLTIRVWDAYVPDTQTIYHCNWGSPARYFGDDTTDALADMKAHGTNVFIDVPPPSAEFDANGSLLQPLNFTQHDAYINQRGPDALFLFRSWAINGPADPFSPVWEKAAIAWLRAWVTHLKEIGVDYKDFALYPIDEPGLSDGLIEEFLRYARIADKADPNIRMYANPVGRANMNDLKQMAPYVDIWCPERRGYLMGMGEDKLAYMFETGESVWMFACEGSYRVQSPLGYFRSQTWQAWRLGLEGVGWWNWCSVPDTQAPDADYTTIYRRDGAVIASKRWEAIRDGIEDHGILRVLKQRADAAAKLGPNPWAVGEARRILGDGVAEISVFAAGDEYATLPGVDGLAGMRPRSDERWGAIQSVRREIAAALEVLPAVELQAAAP
jgi:hypothetical protein